VHIASGFGVLKRASLDTLEELSHYLAAGMKKRTNGAAINAGIEADAPARMK
jgi:hypothetical protein